MDFDETMHFDETLIQTYPYPLAVAAQEVNNATESVYRYICLANLFELSLKYLAAIALAQYLRDPARNKAVQGHLRDLQQPALGAWYTILHGCMGFYKRQTEAAFTVAGLRATYQTKYNGPDKGVSHALLGTQGQHYKVIPYFKKAARLSHPRGVQNAALDWQKLVIEEVNLV